MKLTVILVVALCLLALCESQRNNRRNRRNNRRNNNNNERRRPNRRNRRAGCPPFNPVVCSKEKPESCPREFLKVKKIRNPRRRSVVCHKCWECVYDGNRGLLPRTKSACHSPCTPDAYCLQYQTVPPSGAQICATCVCIAPYNRPFPGTGFTSFPPLPTLNPVVPPQTFCPIEKTVEQCMSTGEMPAGCEVWRPRTALLNGLTCPVCPLCLVGFFADAVCAVCPPRSCPSGFIYGQPRPAVGAFEGYMCKGCSIACAPITISPIGK